MSRGESCTGDNFSPFKRGLKALHEFYFTSLQYIFFSLCRHAQCLFPVQKLCRNCFSYLPTPPLKNKMVRPLVVVLKSCNEIPGPKGLLVKGTLIEYVRDQGQGVRGYTRMHVMQQLRVQQHGEIYREKTVTFTKRSQSRILMMWSCCFGKKGNMLYENPCSPFG